MHIPERRKIARLPLELYVRIRVPGSDWIDFAQTSNVSARGIYLRTQAQLRVGQEVECVLVLPEKLTLSPTPVLVGCRGKVLRVGPDMLGNQAGAAIEVDSYDFSWHDDIADSAKGGN